MTEPLWTWTDLIAATGGVAEGEAHGGITGVSIDTRTLQPGDLFVALRGDTQDGHAYVGKAFEKGAAAALVAADFMTPPHLPSSPLWGGAGGGGQSAERTKESLLQPPPRRRQSALAWQAGALAPASPQGGGGASSAFRLPLIRVSDPSRDPALVGLERLGRAARARLSPEARVIAVTGSVGKTSTKEMLKVCLLSVDPHTHASENSYNNHWGVPLTLARMPKDTRYGVFEIGMNHAGEIALLSPMVRPHVAIITTVGPVHLGFFKNVEEIADAKAEIFLGLEPGGVAVLNADNKFRDLLWSAANVRGARVRTFGLMKANAPDFALGPSTYSGETAEGRHNVKFAGGTLDFEIGAPGTHQALNALAVLAAVESIGINPKEIVPAFERFEAQEGRGERRSYDTANGRFVFVDESYNANPVSMAAALDSIWISGLRENKRRIAVLGDMRELGDQSARLHRELLEPVTAARVDLVFACGPYMRELYDVLPAPLRGAYAEKSTGLIAPLLAAIAPGDVIMVKGSLGTNMKPIVDALKTHLETLAASSHQ